MQSPGLGISNRRIDVQQRLAMVSETAESEDLHDLAHISLDPDDSIQGPDSDVPTEDSSEPSHEESSHATSRAVLATTRPHHRLSLLPAYLFHSAIADPFLYQTYDADHQVQWVSLKPVAPFAQFLHDMVVERLSHCRDYEFELDAWFWRVEALCRFYHVVRRHHTIRSMLIALDLTVWLLRLANQDMSSSESSVSFLPGQFYGMAYPQELQLHWAELDKLVQTKRVASMTLQLHRVRQTKIQPEDSFRALLLYLWPGLASIDTVMLSTGELRLDLTTTSFTPSMPLHSSFVRDWIGVLDQSNWLDQVYLTQKWHDVARWPTNFLALWFECMRSWVARDAGHSSSVQYDMVWHHASAAREVATSSDGARAARMA